MMENNLQKFVVIGIFILLALLLFNLLNIFGLKSGLKSKLIEIKESTRPARLELISIETDCDECFSTDEIVATLKDSDINITNELTLSSSSQEAKSLIEEYSIEKLPTIILKGEINKTSIQDFKQSEDALIFDGVMPPYVDAKTREIVGKVSAIIIMDRSCEVCVDFSTVTQSLQQSNVVFSGVKQIDFSSSEAKEFITKYEIKKIPVLLLSTDIDAYPVAQNLKQAGLQSEKDYYLMESQAPYVEVDSGEVRGLVTLTMVTDDSCQECYDVTVHRQILLRLGLAIEEEKTVDISSSEGNELVEKYDIMKVPTIILTGDVAIYENFNIVWQQVGSVDDGAYVFREMSAMGNIVYKDLSTNQIVGKPTGELKEFTVEGSEYRFNPSTITVNKGDRVRITFKNVGNVGHDFVIGELGVSTRVIPSGSTDTVEFTASRSGTFAFYCSVSGHRSAGMEGQITIG